MSENKQTYGIGTLTAEQAIKNAEEWTKSFANPFADLDQFDAIQNPEQTPREAEHEELKQRTIEWYLARWDKFTGSNIPDLMKSGRGKGEEWGETAKKVIKRLAVLQRFSTNPMGNQIRTRSTRSLCEGNRVYSERMWISNTS